MTDYLGRVAARSLDRLTSLRPRLRSRFESAGTATGWGEEAVELDVETTPPAHHASQGGQPSGRGRGVETRSTADRSAARPPRPRTGGGLEAAVEPGAAPLPRPPAGGRTVPMEAPVELEAVAETLAHRPSTPRAQTAPASSAEPEPWSEGGEVPAGVVPGRRPAGAVREPAPALSRPGPGSDGAGQRPGGRPGPASMLLAPRPGPSLVGPPAPRPALPPDLALEARQERPTVRVSIGRIEVQAPAAPAPAVNAPRRTSTVQSLDAYLEQRRRARQ